MDTPNYMNDWKEKVATCRPHQGTLHRALSGWSFWNSYPFFLLAAHQTCASTGQGIKRDFWKNELQALS